MSERLRILSEQMAYTRKYTYLVLDHTDRARWFEFPPGCPTHIGWQIGHLAMAMAVHTLKTIGGQADLEPLPAGWLELFGKGSVPVADAGKYPSAGQLLVGFDAVYERAMEILAKLPDAVLDEPASHQITTIHRKLDLMYWVVRHEGVHTGQIALMRRMMGEGPYR